MKHWTILCMFCLACQTAVGQLKGVFTANYGLGSQAIQFFEGNKFRYVYVSCIQMGRGKGAYTLENNELVLTFEKDSAKKNYFQIITTPLQNKTSKIHINITALDGETKDTLLGANIILKDRNGQIYQEQMLGLEGFVEMNLPTSTETLYLEIKNMGYETLSCPIIPNQDYQIKAIMFSNFVQTIEAGKQMKFDIEVHEKYIELKEKGKPSAIFERFEKQKE